MEVVVCNNLILADKLRNDDPEQFYTLVKMHLSFVLDLNTDDSDMGTEKKFRSSKWNLPFSKKSKPYIKNTMEGSNLNSDVLEQIRHLINFLSLEDNIVQEGIFRRSGKVTRQQELKSLITQGVSINLTDGRFSVHDCATVLKSILSELPESVLTDAHFPAYCQIADLCNSKNMNNEERLLKSLQLLILLLPSENRIFFQDLIALLHLAASHESKNRMSADNLATLFTPHLLCPRRLSPEALHVNSQVMSRVVAFMIQKGNQLFEIPITLATDLQAYWNKKERRKLSPMKQLNESVCDGTAANTVFSFVDRERTAQENGANPTETALAQLYAYIQSLPESSKKRKLIKQFNKENGHGTPLRALGGKKRTRSRSLGDSIKKHLPVFAKNTKRGDQLNCGDEEYSSPVLRDITACKPSQRDNSCEMPALKQPLPNSKSAAKKTVGENEEVSSASEVNSFQKRLSCDAVGAEASSKSVRCQPEASADEVPAPKKRSSVSPVATPSPRKQSCTVKSDVLLDRIRKRKDVLQQWPVSSQMLPEKRMERAETFQRREEATDAGSVRHVDSQGFVEPPVVFDYLVAKTPSRKFSSNGNLPRFTNNDTVSSPNTTNRVSAVRYGSKSHLLVTSTPAPGNGCIVTPIVDKNNSMSPITRSTQRMPKAMQETMMTPRSRKPVISLSGTDLCHLAHVDSLGNAEYAADEEEKPKRKASEFGRKLVLDDGNDGSDSLSSTFREYLFSRSVLTTSPADLSFSSRTDDFLSLSENNSSGDYNDYKSLPGSILNEDALTDSLLYCLDGNEPESEDGEDEGGVESDTEAAREQSSVSSSSAPSFSDGGEVVNRVYETAL